MSPAQAPLPGWQRRFIAGPPELDSIAALYASLGYDVATGPVGPDDLRAECGDCRLALALFRVIYTRRLA